MASREKPASWRGRTFTRVVGTSRCNVHARVIAGGTKVVGRTLERSVPSPDAALGDGERRSAPSLPNVGCAFTLSPSTDNQFLTR